MYTLYYIFDWMLPLSCGFSTVNIYTTDSHTWNSYNMNRTHLR